MSEPENFLSRWSRRKQEAEQSGEAQDHPSREPDAAPDSTLEQSAVPEPAPDKEPPVEFDLSSLPSIETIGADSDIRAFLQKGVPLELTRAALRRAWTSDPAIRNFIEVAENQWDFATGSDLPGFGALQPSDDLRRMLEEMFQERPVAEAERQEAGPGGTAGADAQITENQRDPQEAGHGDEPSAGSADAVGAAVPPSTSQPEVTVHRKEETAAMQQGAEKSDRLLLAKGRHGRALPK